MWIHLRDYFDYHKLTETKNEKLINYSPRHHKFLYLRIIFSSEAANLEILGFYTGSKLYFSPSVRVCVDFKRRCERQSRSTFDTEDEDLKILRISDLCIFLSETNIEKTNQSCTVFQYYLIQVYLFYGKQKDLNYTKENHK